MGRGDNDRDCVWCDNIQSKEGKEGKTRRRMQNL